MIPPLPVVFEKGLLFKSFGLKNQQGHVLLKPEYSVMKDFDGRFFSACRLSRWFCYDEKGRQLILYRPAEGDGAAALPDFKTFSNIFVNCCGFAHCPVFIDPFGLVKTYEKKLSGRWHVIDTSGRVLLSAQREADNAGRWNDKIRLSFELAPHRIVQFPHPEAIGASPVSISGHSPALLEKGRLKLPGYQLTGKDAKECLLAYVQSIEADSGLPYVGTDDFTAEDGIHRYTLRFGGRLSLQVEEERHCIRFFLIASALPDGIPSFAPGSRILLGPGKIREITNWQEHHDHRFYTKADHNLPEEEYLDPDDDEYDLCDLHQL